MPIIMLESDLDTKIDGEMALSQLGQNGNVINPSFATSASGHESL
jgi:hypothetical protein